MKRADTWKALIAGTALSGFSLFGIGLATHNTTDDELGGALGAMSIGAGLVAQNFAGDRRRGQAQHLPLRAVWGDRL